MKNKLFKNALLILLFGASIAARAQTDTVAIQWQQFMAQLDSIAIESKAHFPIAQSLMRFAEKQYPKTHSNYNISLYHYATGLLINGQTAQADSLFKQGWNWMQSRQPADTLAFAQWYTLKGNLFQLKNDLQAAMKVNDEATQYLQNTKNRIIKKYLIDFHLSNATMASMSDQSSKILSEAQKVLDWSYSEKEFPKNDNIALALIFTARGQRHLGNYTQAIALIEKHLSDFPKTDAYYLIVQEKAHIYADMRLFDKSLDTWKQVLDYASTNQTSYLYATTLDNYAFVLGCVKQYEKAFAAASEALPILLKYKVDDNRFYPLCLSHQAMYGAELHKWDTIRPMIQELEMILAKAQNTSAHLEFVRSNLVRIYELMGNLPKAIQYQKENVDNMRQFYGKGESHSSTGLRILAELYFENNQFEECRPIIQTLLSANNNKMVYQFELLDEKEKELYLKGHLQNTIKVSLLALQKYRQKDTIAQQLLYDALLATKGVVLKSTKRMQQLAATHVDTAVQRLYQTRSDIKRQLGKLYLAKDSSKKIQKPILERDLDQVERQLVVKLPLLEQSFQKITHQTVQKSLKSKAAAIEFIHCSYRNPKTSLDTTLYAALILKPNQAFPELVFLFEEHELKKVLKNAPKITDLYPKRSEKGSKTATFTENAPAHALYELIWKPLLPHLDSVQTIYYAPSGMLNQLSFDALRLNDSTFLSDPYQLHRCLSTGELVFEHEQPLAIQSALLYGGINYDENLASVTPPAQTRGHHEAQQDPQITHFQELMNHRGGVQNAWSYLEGTQKEIDTLSQLFKKQQISVQVQNQNAASETHFKGLGHQTATPTILHLATHGFSFPAPQKDSAAQSAFQEAENPLIRSGLILAGANQAWLGKPIPAHQEDGILTAYEISNMQLNDIKLVVLSACKTGLGDARGTEGVYGLERAFKMAGVSYLVVSLWDIPDKQTSVFMEAFYQNLLAKQPVRQAFSNAQTAMKLKYEPYYWAGLVLVR